MTAAELAGHLLTDVPTMCSNLVGAVGAFGVDRLDHHRVVIPEVLLAVFALDLLQTVFVVNAELFLAPRAFHIVSSGASFADLGNFGQRHEDRDFNTIFGQLSIE